MHDVSCAILPPRLRMQVKEWVFNGIWFRGGYRVRFSGRVQSENGTILSSNLLNLSRLCFDADRRMKYNSKACQLRRRFWLLLSQISFLHASYFVSIRPARRISKANAAPTWKECPPTYTQVAPARNFRVSSFPSWMRRQPAVCWYIVFYKQLVFNICVTQLYAYPTIY